MKIAIVLCAILSGVCSAGAGVTGPRSAGPGDTEPRSAGAGDIGPRSAGAWDTGPRSDSEERETEAIRVLFDALKGLSYASTGEADPVRALLEQLENIALTSAADRELSREERNEKYSSAVFHVLEEYARTAIGDEQERNTFLAIIRLSKNLAKNQSYEAAPDKAAFLARIEHLFDLVKEPFPGTGAGGGPRDGHDREKEQFLAVLDSVLDDIRL